MCLCEFVRVKAAKSLVESITVRCDVVAIRRCACEKRVGDAEEYGKIRIQHILVDGGLEPSGREE